MTRDVEQLEELLAHGPEDWSVRITLIEERIRRDNKEGAKKLVRESPDHSPLPYELQYRLHQLMTRGKDVLDPLPEPQEAAASPESVVPAEKEPVADVEEKIPDVEPVAEEEKQTITPVPPAKTDSPEIEPVPPELPADNPVPEGATSNRKPNFDEEFAPIKGAAEKAKKEKAFALKKPKSTPEIELKKNTDGDKKWNEYRGNLMLTDGEVPPPAPAPRQRTFAAEKVSALTLALVVHLVVIVSAAFVAIAKNRPKPPELIVSVVHEKEVELQTTRLNKTEEKRLSAAAAQSVSLVSTLGASTIKIPEMEPTDNTDVTSLVTGIETTGVGLSFMGARDVRSDVNFFGISGGGDRVVFVIDATKPMLIDEKGGMFAYDKVKNEIAAMLNELRRGTFFNILLYEGKRVVAFREKPVAGLPSNRRKAIEWLDPLNRDYESLGLRNGYSEGQIELTDTEVEPIQTQDLAHYTKCIQKALEWQASAVFCISSGYGQMGQSPTPEMIEKYKDTPRTPGTPGTISAAERKAWNDAQAKAREWLQKENDARREKGLPPKVVLNFNDLVKQVTGQSPPRATGGTPASGGMPRLPNHTPEDIEKHVRNLVDKYYDDEGREKPSIHMVLFLGEKEDIGQYEDHFKNLTRKNRGKLKALRGLAELKDVTGD